MIELTDQAAADALLERFSRFYDAILVEVHLALPRSARERRATLRVLAQATDGDWCSVAFVVEPLTEFAFVEGRSSNLVLSDGAGIHVLDGGIFVDLAPYSDEPAGIEDLRRSRQYVVGGSCAVEVGLFRE